MPLAEFKKTRGFNYIASWSGNSISQWRFYNYEQTGIELGYLASIGCNSIRVWLNFAVWDVERQAFLLKLSDLLQHATSRGISVMLILWDSVGKLPSETPYDDTVGWTANPGPDKVVDPSFRDQGDAYVKEVVQVATASGADVIWDVMNEPDNLPVEWVEHYLALVKALDPTSPRTVGYFQASAALQTSELVDIISFHPYGIFRANVEVPAKEAAAIASVQNTKPVLATECGFPGGGGQRYEDVLDYLREEGVGFYLFQAMIGDHPAFPWKGGTGFFYKDGTVRDLEAVRAFQSLAKAQGFELVEFPLVASEDNPLWFPYQPIPAGFGAPEAAELMINWSAHYGVDYPLVEDALEFYLTLLGWVYASLWLAKVLNDQEVKVPQQYLDELNEAAAQEDWEAASSVLTSAAEMAGAAIDAAGLAEPENRPPEILHAEATPNPFPGDTNLKIVVYAWDPDGIDDVVASTALVFGPEGDYLFSLPLEHKGSGIFAFDSKPLDPFEPGQTFELLLVVGDEADAKDQLFPLTITATEPAGEAPSPGGTPPRRGATP
ncbi:MAG: hypothetical protein AAF682_17385 [Planctomycetota bacterium]